MDFFLVPVDNFFQTVIDSVILGFESDVNYFKA